MAKEKIKIRFYFSYLFLPGDEFDTNTFKVFIDGNLVIDEILVDKTGGHDILQRIVEVEKGYHIIEAKYLEINATQKYEKDFKNNIGLKVYADTDDVEYVKNLDKLKLYFKEFPFNKVFKIR